MCMAELFSLSEAAAIAEITPDAIRTALEKKSVKSSHRKRAGKAVRHQFSAGDILLVKVLTEFPFALSKDDKRSLAHILANGGKQAENWSRRGSELLYRSGEMQLRIAFRPIQQKVARNIALFRWGRRRIVSSSDVLAGEPVFRGTRIPLRHVASLFRKSVPEQEIAEEFPYLKARDLQYARLAASFVERPGRPKKRLVMQRQSRAA